MDHIFTESLKHPNHSNKYAIKGKRILGVPVSEYSISKIQANDFISLCYTSVAPS